ncbi:hypothetical protein GH733_008297 [Mirounga leonina]|nr:hypothetical protein GH733_008297 [Mirounga leonina]
MKPLLAWLLCLLLLGLALKGAASQAHQHSMEIRSECPDPGPQPPSPAPTPPPPAPDINPAWYTGRRIRPVGRFGRRRAALGDVAKPRFWRQPACFPLRGGTQPAQDG